MSETKKGRPYSPAQGKATKNYIAAHRDRFTAMMDKGALDVWHAAAEAAGTSTNKYVIEAVEHRIFSDIMTGAIPDVRDEAVRAEILAQKKERAQG